MKILIVDDSKHERVRLVAAFVETDVVVIGAVGRLHSALHALAENPPDVIVTDCVLGEDHARHLIAAARRSATKPSIVVFASINTVEERRRCLEAGADRFVAKAAGIPALHRAVTEAFAARTRPNPRERYALVGRLAEGVAHDLNNVLGAIDVSLALMKKRPAGLELAEEISTLRRAVDNAIRLTASMTRLARGSTPPYGGVDVASVIKRVVEQFRSSLPQTVKLELDPVPTVECTELEIEQCVLDLLLDCKNGDGDVTIRLHAPSQTVRLEIIDHEHGTHETIDFERVSQ